MSSEVEAEKVQLPESEPPSPITLLPEEVFVDIIARVPRCYYPTISFVSRRFRSVVASYEYLRRSLLSCTEHCLYVVVCNLETHDYNWYILVRKINSNRLALIPSLPAMPLHGNFVSVGSKIYVFDMPSSVLSNDCRSHTVQTLPGLPITMARTIIATIDGKIYVIGDHQSEIGLSGRIMVFDTETDTWEPEITKVEMELGHLWSGCVVMDDKIYMRDSFKTIVYRPKDRKWENDEMLHSRMWSNVCVVDDILYSYNDGESKLETYDPKRKCWGAVEGVGRLLPGKHWWQSHTVSYGKKLVVFLFDNEGDGSSLVTSNWCAEIALERRQGGEIWGNVEWCDVVLSGEFAFGKSLAVLV